MRKLAGTDVIVLIKTALKDEVVLKEASALSRNDFAKDDLIVNCFYKLCPDGFSSNLLQNKVAGKNLLNSLESVKKEILNSGIRKAFNYLQNVRNASDEAVKLENELNDIQSYSIVEYQHRAAKLINFLAKYGMAKIVTMVKIENIFRNSFLFFNKEYTQYPRVIAVIACQV